MSPMISSVVSVMCSSCTSSIGSSFSLPSTDFRTFRIEQNGYGLAQFLAGLADILDPVAVLLKIAVREVQSGDIHACFDQFLQHSPSDSLAGPIVHTIFVLRMIVLSS